MGRGIVEFDTQDPNTGERHTIIKTTITGGIGGVGSNNYDEEVPIKITYMTKRDQVPVIRIDDYTYEIQFDLVGRKGSLVVKRV